MKDKTYVWFGAHGYAVEPSVITQLMRLEPTEVLIKDQPKPKVPRMLSDADAWVLHSQLPTSAHVEEHVEALLRMLESRTNEIKYLAEVYRAEVEIGCAIYYYEDFTPGVHLSRAMLQRIATLGLSLDLDLYFLGMEQT